MDYSTIDNYYSYFKNNIEFRDFNKSTSTLPIKDFVTNLIYYHLKSFEMYQHLILVFFYLFSLKKKLLIYYIIICFTQKHNKKLFKNFN